MSAPIQNTSQETTWVDRVKIVSYVSHAGQLGETFAFDVLGMFKTRSKELIDDIHKSIQAQNFDRLSHCAHSLKGISLTIGASVMGKISSLLESEGRAKAQDYLQHLAHELESARIVTMDELERVVRELQQKK